MTEDTELTPDDMKKAIALAILACVLLTVATVLAYQHARSRTPQIVLPGGITYLGPSGAVQAPVPTQPIATEKIPISADSAWNTWKGQIYPYAFSYPSGLSLGFFPKDPFDAVTIFLGNTNPQENLLLRVEDLNVIPDMKRFIAKPKRDYVENWGKQYGYIDVVTLTPFTNGNGLAGFHVVYKGSPGRTPVGHVFFEVPGRPELMIWMTDKLLPKDIFNRIVDSLVWQRNATMKP